MFCSFVVKEKTRDQRERRNDRPRYAELGGGAVKKEGDLTFFYIGNNLWPVGQEISQGGSTTVCFTTARDM